METGPRGLLETAAKGSCERLAKALGGSGTRPGSHSTPAAQVPRRQRATH